MDGAYNKGIKSKFNAKTGDVMPKKFSTKVYEHADEPGEGAKKRKGLMKKDKVRAVMGEFKRGTLRSGGSGKKITSRDQAIAVALSEAGLNKAKKRK